MKRSFASPTFVRILLAALLPLILIFSVTLFIVARNTFQASKEAAQEKMSAFAQQSVEQVRGNLYNSSRLIKLAAHGLAAIASDSDEARKIALDFLEPIFESAPNAIRIRIYFEPGENAFGKDGIFAYELFRESGVVARRPLTLGNDADLDLSLPQYVVPLQKGVAYHYSIASFEKYGLPDDSAYIASANYPVIHGGKVIGCVGMEMLYRKSLPLIDQLTAEGSHPFIFRADGTILYAADTHPVGRKIDSLGLDADVLEKIATAVQQEKPFTGEAFSPITGKESLILIHPIGLSPQLSQIFMYIETPTEIVYSGAVASIRTMFLTFLTGLLLFTGCLFAVTRNIVKPIKGLTESAKLIANGQFEGVLDTFDENHKTRDEVYILGCSMQKMLKGLLNIHNLKIIALEAKQEKIKLEEAAAAKDRFFANMSHEIRTPMNVILGMSEILLMEKLTNDQKKFIHDIKVSSESLLNIINDILDLSRLESGKLSLLPIHYDFSVLVENIYSLGKYMAEKKGLNFGVETIGDMPGYLFGDDGRLRQVLLNIIGNAIKFTNEGSVALIIVDEGERLRFDIVDTGIGVREEDMKYLFEPFKQIDGPEVRNVKGTGLGLSICQNLVKLMGGTITVDSEYGKGTSFHVMILKVLGDSAKVESSKKMLPYSFDPGSRVLVVDDSEGNLRVAREFLRMFGITASTASSGMEAVTLAANSDFDLIFMDHMMPGMDGVEATRRIRALGDHQARVPIIALTANAVIGARELLLASGFDAFLAKPIEKLKFQGVLAKWLPKNLVIRENHEAFGEHSAFDSAQMTGIDGTMDVSGGGFSKDSRVTRILASVSKLKDLNIPLGLNRVADNLDLYVDLLGMIVERIPETLIKIDTALSKDDATSLNIEIHTLKGSLANLGAVDLAADAAELEQLGTQGEFGLFMEGLEPFRRKLEAFVHKLQENLSIADDGAQPVSSGDGTQLKAALRELHSALSGFDYMESMKVIGKLSLFDWGESYNLGLKAVTTHIKHFDYDAALNELHRGFTDME